LRFKIKKCPRCKSYTLKEKCPKCGSRTLIAHPARFSPDDRYALLKALGTGKIDLISSRKLSDNVN